MDEQGSVSSGARAAHFVHEMRQPWRALCVWLLRRSIRRRPMEGVLGIDRRGHVIWAPGYPEAYIHRG